MYLHLGLDTVIRMDEVVAIFDIDNSSVAKSTKAYLAAAQKRGEVINVCTDLPKSFVVCKGVGETRVYISQISPSTLKKRAGFIDGIANARNHGAK